MSRDKESSFTKLIDSRIVKLKQDFKLIRNLSNRYNYEYTDAQIESTFSQIDKLVAEARLAFKNAPVPKGKNKLATAKIDAPPIETPAPELIRTSPEDQIKAPEPEDVVEAGKPVPTASDEAAPEKSSDDEDFKPPQFLLKKKEKVN